jgi:alpha-L-fucosidase
MGAVLFAVAAMAADQPGIKGPTVLSDALPRPTAAQAQWQDYEIGIFYHYDINCCMPREWGHRSYDNFPKPEIFNPTNFNIEQWMEVPKALNAKYAVLTATHGTGFMLWQSDAYPFGVRQSPWNNGKGDIVREYVDACRKHGVAPGMYCHMRVNGWWQVDHPGFVNRGKGGDDALQARYAAAKNKQMEELWGNYGPLAEIWIDGGPPDPKAGYDVMSHLRRLQPKAMVADERHFRWIGGEQGKTGYPCWSTGTNPFDANSGSPDGKDWCPAEADVDLIRGAWNWYQGSDAAMYRLDELMEIYYGSVGNNCNLLINAAPDRNGLIPEAQLKRFREFGAEIQRRLGKSLAETTGEGKMLELPLGKAQAIDHLMLMEKITEGERVREYVVQGKVGEAWQKIGRGTCIGHKRIERIKPVEVAAVRLRIIKSVGTPLIRKLAVYDTTANP